MSSTEEMREKTVRDLLAAVDANDTSHVASYFSENAYVIFGSPEPMRGPQAVKETLDQFMSTISGLRHDISQMWTCPDGVAAEADAVYTRLDRSQVTIPVVSACKFNADGLVNDYRVYMDLTPLFA